MSYLAYYTEKAKRMTAAELHYALEDVKATLAIWDRNPAADPDYVAKLWAEFDAYTVEKYRRQTVIG